MHHVDIRASSNKCSGLQYHYPFCKYFLTKQKRTKIFPQWNDVIRPSFVSFSVWLLSYSKNIWYTRKSGSLKNKSIHFKYMKCLDNEIVQTLNVYHIYLPIKDRTILIDVHFRYHWWKTLWWSILDARNYWSMISSLGHELNNIMC